MAKTIAVSENLQGNIGACQVNTTRYNVSLFTEEVTATDSCTGQIIEKNQMFDTDWLFFFLLVFMVGVWAVWLLKGERY